MGPAAKGRAGSGGAPPRAAAASAALALTIGLFALALPLPAPVSPPCDSPGETVALEGHTLEVRCDAIAGPELRGPARMLFGLRIDPNRADSRTLETLPRIGPSRAAAIVEARGERPFSDVADLERVPGIGPKTRRAIEPWLATSSEASLPQNR